MRILNIINSSNPAGGGPIESILQAARALSPAGHRLEMACMDAPDSPWLKNFAIPVHALGPAWTKFRYAAGFEPWLQNHAHDFDAAIVHGIWLYPSFGTWRAARKTRLPYFVYTHGLLDPVLKSVFPLKHIAKTLAWKLIDHRVIRDATAVLFTCEEERDLALRSFQPFLGKPEIVPYCVGEPEGDADRQRAAFFQRFPECRDRRLLLFLSRIHPKKGCDLLLEAFAEVLRDRPDFRLVMAGPDSIGWQEQLQKKAAQSGIGDRITWAGMLQGDLKWGAFRSAEAFILPSHQENFGIAVVEALACSIPVLITKRINIWREITTDQAGLAAADDPDGISQLLRGWISMADDHRAAMKVAARNCFATRFRAEAAARNLIQILRKHGINDSD